MIRIKSSPDHTPTIGVSRNLAVIVACGEPSPHYNDRGMTEEKMNCLADNSRLLPGGKS